MWSESQQFQLSWLSFWAHLALLVHTLVTLVCLVHSGNWKKEKLYWQSRGVYCKNTIHTCRLKKSSHAHNRFSKKGLSASASQWKLCGIPTIFNWKTLMHVMTVFLHLLCRRIIKLIFSWSCKTVLYSWIIP